MTSVTAAADLRARVRRGDGRPLLEWLGHAGTAWLPESGLRFVTAGTATTVRATDAAERLAQIAVDGADSPHPGIRPIAAGACGWDLNEPLAIPARTVFEIDGAQWIVDIDPAQELAMPVARPTAAARHFEVDALQDRREWTAQVVRALHVLDGREIRKVVLAREVVVRADVEFDIVAILERLRRDQPGCVVFAAGDLVGASPELLVSRFGNVVRSRPMAGTVERRADVSDDDAAVSMLLRSAKEANEHALVVDAVVATFAAAGLRPEVAGPFAERFSSVAHLVTDVTAIATDAPDAAALACRLHPTPAVGGTPSGAAIDLIARLEQFDRGSYAGPVGWVDAAGDGAFMVALRGATLAGNQARVLAGAGIVVGSDPDSEWAETQAKLEPVLRALVRP